MLRINLHPEWRRFKYRYLQRTSIVPDWGFDS